MSLRQFLFEAHLHIGTASIGLHGRLSSGALLSGNFVVLMPLNPKGTSSLFLDFAPSFNSMYIMLESMNTKAKALLLDHR